MLSGCNGHDNAVISSDNTSIGSNAQLGVSVTDASNVETQNITIGNSATITVQLSDLSGVAIVGQSVVFTASSGSLSASSRLTNSNGQTSVSYNSSGVNPGVVTVTAEVTIDNETTQVAAQFEVLDTITENGTEPSIEITLKRDGQSINRIREGESAQLGVSLVDQNNNPIENAIVNFSAERGTLNASSALTNANGLAEVKLTAQANQLGAAVASISTSLNNVTYSDNVAYEVVSADALDQSTSVLLGYFANDGSFVEGQLKSDLVDADNNTTISAGATLGLSAVLVDQDFNRITAPTTITFSSSCTNASKASIDTNVTTVNGQASTTYQDINCAGSQGNEDTVVATVRVNSADLTATRLITLLPENIGSIEFISASPESIVLKGTGGQGKQETATVTFLVKGELGNPLNQQQVNFALNTDVGGLSLAASTGVTNSDGFVGAKVVSGSVPTVVRVSATVTNSGNVSITTQSDLLSVNTGLPDQNSFTLSLSTINPEARNITGTNVTVRAYLADSFNNPVPDGTVVNFTTEGGAIEPSCTTQQGNCSVTWTSQEPFADDHRVTILATAEGHEYFVDVNGNNVYDDADGGAQNASIDGSDGKDTIDEIVAGFGRISALSSGYIDMPEAWRDDNENYLHDSGELFIDANNDGSRTVENGLFNGPQCQGNNCSTAKFSTIRKSRVLITSSSSALYRLIDDASGDVLKSNYDNSATNAAISIPYGSSRSLSLEMSDTQFQILPKGTAISIVSSIGEMLGGGTVEVANSVGSSNPAIPGTITLGFTVINNLAADDEAATGGLEFRATTPSSRITGDNIVVVLQQASP